MINDCEVEYVRSPYLQTIYGKGLVLIWHSLFGYPKIISNDTINFLNQFSTPATLYSRLKGSPNKENSEAIIELINCYFLVPVGFNDRDFLKSELEKRDNEIVSGALINYLGLIMSEACNFRCKYCIHFKNLETSNRIDNPEKFMQFETAKVIVDGYLDILRGHNKYLAEVNFGGGEPLMNWPVIEQVLNYCETFYASEFSFIFSINTNISLMTKEIALVLKKHKVEIAGSLDGLQPENDQVRIMKSGGGTYSQIVNGFKILKEVGYPIDNFAITITEDNFYGINESIIDWAFENDIRSVRIDIDVIGMVDIPIEIIVKKLLKIRKYAISKEIDVPGFWSRPSENLNESTLESHVAFCGGSRGNSICVSPSGEIYSCGYSTARIGDIHGFESFSESGSLYYSFVKEHLTGMKIACIGCCIEGQCNGGCNITQEFSREKGTKKIERMCDFYRSMTQGILQESLEKIIE